MRVHLIENFKAAVTILMLSGFIISVKLIIFYGNNVNVIASGLDAHEVLTVDVSLMLLCKLINIVPVEDDCQMISTEYAEYSLNSANNSCLHMFTHVI